MKKLTGMCVCPGEVEGKITIYNKDKVYCKDDVVVLNTHMTQNVLQLKDAGAILSSEGGITCHASILAREMNVPCLVGVKGLKELKEGTKVKVDTTDELIIILE